MISQITTSELLKVLLYPKFRLSPENRQELLAEYLPFCTVISSVSACLIICRDRKDQAFLDLAESGACDCLVTGDQDLLALRGQTRFAIKSPEDYRRHFPSP